MPREGLAAALRAGGRTWILSNRDASGATRSRPVWVWADDADLVRDHPVVHVLTGADARKAADLESDPSATIAGPVGSGWFAAGADVQVLRDPEQVGRVLAAVAPEVPADGVAVLRLTVREARRWTVRSDRPFDNRAEQLIGEG